jgi:hypothetical protein
LDGPQYKQITAAIPKGRRWIILEVQVATPDEGPLEFAESLRNVITLGLSTGWPFLRDDEYHVELKGINFVQ